MKWKPITGLAIDLLGMLMAIAPAAEKPSKNDAEKLTGTAARAALMQGEWEITTDGKFSFMLGAGTFTAEKTSGGKKTE